MARKGWVVEASTTRPGCEADERHQRWRKSDAEALADEIRAAHAGDDCHRVIVRRETADDEARECVGYYDS